ncbi:uncharacterized protein EI90DRAFT_2916594 [Cantharellus anzutake]|uniref:uncharacterized protein n=1 Tax=Cantharellus anzutake TaxID=1750568 RepID=UPI001904C96F|nr:uncharacterized protein EI90DRAFT_2916594 [Cantharellus anzutake]KAF8333467.1 hypothetical protein EI90DRAFT_2916594 [Cantharellus anzutake]
MASLSTSDILVVALGLVLGTLYLYKDSLFSSKSIDGGFKLPNGNAAIDPRDFVARLKQQKKRIAIFYGSQTGTAEEYAIRLAKEAKSKFGLSSLVCDAEEYDIDKLDTLPSDCCVVFVMATYGEGEPTDNAVQLVSNLRDDSFEFSSGNGHRVDGVKYVVFGLGNRTYEHYNIIGRQVDEAMTKMGGVRIGERGEGDDDKSMEEDYLAWKDGMWEEFGKAMGVEEGAGGDTPDFVVREIKTADEGKVYLGELSARALNKTKGIHDAKNPYAAPIQCTKELFAVSHARHCVHMEFNIEGSGLTYQHGDHVGIWPPNSEVEVTRLLATLGLLDVDPDSGGKSKLRSQTVIDIESLDPALAKVPFPVPTTYDTVLRYYLDISAVAGRQVLNVLSRYAPSEEAKTVLGKLGSDKAFYGEVVAGGCLKLGEVLQFAAGDEVAPVGVNREGKLTKWNIPFDVIVSALPRLQPRYYSISSSPKLYPTSIHVTCVVLTYESEGSSVDDQGRGVGVEKGKRVFGVASNYLLNLKGATYGEVEAGVEGQGLVDANGHPTYAIGGPRNAYAFGPRLYKAPVHVRRSAFRLPTNPKTPVLMVGPGTGVAPFRGFVQERVALARKALDKNGPDALSTWGRIQLFYGCRSEHEDYLYRDEWPGYMEELKGKFEMHCAFSRSGKRKPDGSKIYVQDLIWDQRETIGKMISSGSEGGKGYVYICGDAKSMSKSVEEVLARILGEFVLGKGIEEGWVELKAMKERSRLLLDVWS